MATVTSRGTLTYAARNAANANIHPQHWDGKVDRYDPLGDFPLMKFLDGMSEGDPAKDTVLNWFRKDYNALVGEVNDIYVDVGFNTAYSSGPAAVGTRLVVRPTTASLPALNNVQEGMQVIFRSTSTATNVKARVVAVSYEGAHPSFTIVTIEADTSRALEGTGITWTLAQNSNGENWELGEAISEHETNEYNYIYTDSEPFAMSVREQRSFSRIMEDKKKERELDALRRLTWRREITALEGIRQKVGDIYYAGGLRFFLNEHHPDNIRDWRTDHSESDALSAASDSPLMGTLPFLTRCFQKARPFARPGAKRVIETSSYGWGVINASVRASGSYQIDYATNRYGINVKYLRGQDEEWEIWENPQMDHTQAFKRTAYLIIPEHFKRHTPEDSASNASKGLEYVKWSDPKKQDGETRTSRMKGGWITEETYTFRQLATHMIVDNLGETKV